MKAIADAGHEIGLHGYSHENPAKMTATQEAAVLDRTIELVENLSGQRPTGYVAPFWEFSERTVELLLERGIKYDHSLMHHDFKPYYVRTNDTWTKLNYDKSASEWMKPLVRGQVTNLIEIPASWYADDLPPMMFMDKEDKGLGYVNPRDIEQLWQDRFDWMYRAYDYAVYTMTIHPDVSGHPQVLLMLERLYDYMNEQPGVEFVTFDKIASNFAQRQTQKKV